MALPTNRAGVLDAVPVVPVVVLERVADAVPLARALVAGGLPAIELTLRTPAALDAVRAIAEEVLDILLGVGTVTSPAQAERARAAGADFLVSPGATPSLVAAMADTGLPFLPGVATASEAMAVLETGRTEMKLFPASAVGGTGLLRALAGPLPTARFCPTGGITPATAPDYLALPNVGCVGGSWLAPAALVDAGDWSAITELARAAAGLRRPELRPELRPDLSHELVAT